MSVLISWGTHEGEITGKRFYILKEFILFYYFIFNLNKQTSLPRNTETPVKKKFFTL